MPDPLHVIANERETVRVFVVDLAPTKAKTWAKVHSNIEAAVGAELDQDHMETFPSDDLKDFGLSQFLVDGYGIAEADIAPDKDRLDAAKPQIVLLRARAFGGTEVTLSPKVPLIHLGTYGQAKADPSAPTAPRTPEATPAPRAPAAEPWHPPRPRPRRGARPRR